MEKFKVLFTLAAMTVSAGVSGDLETVADFVVVGGGSAGCVVANRLSENPDWKVVLLEAGKDELLEHGIPASPPYRDPSINWNYFTERSLNSCLSRKHNRCPVPSGKVLGGSSVINYMIYFRGSRQDYDEWAALGNEGWGYDDVLKYFKMSEDNGDADIASNVKYHSTGGYLHVKRFSYVDENLHKIIEGFKELNIPLRDVNAESSIGVMMTQFTQKNNTRMSTNTAFIKPIFNRYNLKIIINVIATKILINDFNIAYGIEYVNEMGIKHKITVNKEVIVSAGAINSPKLLILSGIGPKEDIIKHNINVIKDLPVGKNYQDHVTFGALSISLDEINSVFKRKRDIDSDKINWFQTRVGPMGSMGTISCNAFIKINQIDPNVAPDIQYILDGTYIKERNRNISALNRLPTKPLAYYNHINIKPILLRPKSVGHIILNNDDPVFGKPHIHANFLTEEDDLEMLVDSVEFALNLFKTKAFRSLGSKPSLMDISPCNNLEGRDKWRCAIRHFTGTIFHPVGTCKMGPVDDGTAVVNPKLEVHGIRHLRIVDASVMPNIVRSNTNAPVIMIGEKGASMIKEKWNKRDGKAKSEN